MKKIRDYASFLGGVAGAALAIKVYTERRKKLGVSEGGSVNNTENVVEQVVSGGLKGVDKSSVDYSQFASFKGGSSLEDMEVLKSILRGIEDNREVRMGVGPIDLDKLGIDYRNLDPAEVTRVNEFISRLHDLVLCGPNEFVGKLSDFFTNNLSNALFEKEDFLICLKIGVRKYLSSIEGFIPDELYQLVSTALETFLNGKLVIKEVYDGHSYANIARWLESGAKERMDSFENFYLMDKPVSVASENLSSVAGVEDYNVVTSGDLPSVAGTEDYSVIGSGDVASVAGTEDFSVIGGGDVASVAGTEDFSVIASGGVYESNIFSWVEDLYNWVLTVGIEPVGASGLEDYSSDKLIVVVVLLCVGGITIGWVRSISFLLNDRLLLFYKIQEKYPKAYKFIDWNRKVSVIHLVTTFTCMFILYTMLVGFCTYILLSV